MMDKEPHKVRFINPPNRLKLKVGHGGIDESLLKKSENYLESVNVDFVPYAEDFLADFSKYAKEARDAEYERKDAKEKIANPVMQLKANGGMFQYLLITDVADIALQFLDAIEEINDDAYQVLVAHENTINAIITNNLKGDGGREGYALVQELHKACKRYFSKYHPN